MKPVWNDHRLGQLKRYYIDQGISASHTARLIGGVTRNAVIGAAHRAGFQRSAEVNLINQSNGWRERPDRAPRTPREPKLKAPTNPVPFKEARMFSPPNPRHWETRKTTECAWPVSGEGADTFYCCEPVHSGSWCAAHCRIGHAKTWGMYADTPAQLERRLRRYAA